MNKELIAKYLLNWHGPWSSIRVISFGVVDGKSIHVTFILNGYAERNTTIELVVFEKWILDTRIRKLNILMIDE